jgi:hypothetical protein
MLLRPTRAHSQTQFSRYRLTKIIPGDGDFQRTPLSIYMRRGCLDTPSLCAWLRSAQARLRVPRDDAKLVRYEFTRCERVSLALSLSNVDLMRSVEATLLDQGTRWSPRDDEAIADLISALSDRHNYLSFRSAAILHRIGVRAVPCLVERQMHLGGSCSGTVMRPLFSSVTTASIERY